MHSNRSHKLKVKYDGLPAATVTSLLAAILIAQAAFGADPIFVDAQAVEFDSAAFTYKPSPFRVKQARKLGKPVEIRTQPSVPITGYLARPDTEAPSAAIVLLHTCAGISEHEQSWSDRLVNWGYVVFSVDSFTPRGTEYVCDGRPGSTTTPWIRALDAYGAKQYLAAQSFVDPARIAVMGMSHGGMAVLEVIKQSTAEGLTMNPFQAAIALYPMCSDPPPIDTPALILTGALDSWTPAQFCAQYVDSLKPQHDIGLKVLEGAYHLFDHPGIDAVEVGYIIRSNPEAAAEASAAIREFLAKHL